MSGQRWTDAPETPSEAVYGLEYYETRCNHPASKIFTRAQEMPEPTPVVGPLCLGQVGFLAGPQGSGKSLFALSVMAAAVRGRGIGEWVAHPHDSMRLGFLLDAEMTPHDLADRISFLDIEAAPITYNYCDSRERIGMPPFLLGDPEHQKWLMHCCQSFDVVVIDNVTFTLDPAPGHNLYAPETINQLRPLFSWARNTGKLLILIDHTNHEGKLAGSMNKGRLADWVGVLTPDPLPDDAAAAFTLSFGEKWRSKNRPRRDTAWTLDLQGRWESKEIIPLPDQIMEMIAQGATTGDICSELGCSDRYVRQVKRRSRQ